MPDLKDQIRTYYEATTEPVDVDEVIVESGTVLVGPFPDAAQRRAMDTKSDSEQREDIAQRNWRGPLLAAAAFVAVLSIGIGIGIAVGASENVAEPATPATTLVEEEGAPGAAIDSNNATVVFNGDACTFEATPMVEVGTQPRFTLVNESDRPMRMSIWHVPPETTAEDVDGDDDWFRDRAFGNLGTTVSVDPGESAGVTVFPVEPGRYMANCFDPDREAGARSDNFPAFFEIGAG